MSAVIAGSTAAVVAATRLRKEREVKECVTQCIEGEHSRNVELQCIDKCYVSPEASVMGAILFVVLLLGLMGLLWYLLIKVS